MKFVKSPELKCGQKAEIIKFAFLPVKIDETTTVWLEKYIECYTVEKVLKSFPTGIGMYGVWLGYYTEWVPEWVLQYRKVIK